MIRDKRFKAVLQDPQFPVQIDIELNGIVLEAIRRSIESMHSVRTEGGAEWIETPSLRTHTLVVSAPHGRIDEARDAVERFVQCLYEEVHNRKALLICDNDDCMKIGLFNSRALQPQPCRERKCGRGKLIAYPV